MKLFYSPGACSLADHIALIESGVAFETEKVDLKAKTTESGSDYTQINPKEYVPALMLDDGAILTENVAILSYIAEQADNLTPHGNLGRFRMLEALAYISTELHKGFKPFFARGSDADKDEARKMLGKRFALFEDALASQQYAVGDTFSVVDCYLFVMLHWAKTKAGVDVPAHLTGYYEHLMGRDSVRKALADEGLA